MTSASAKDPSSEQFHDGRWMPDTSSEQSANFDFLRPHPHLHRILVTAERNLHVDANTTLYKLRRFAEALAIDAVQRIAPPPMASFADNLSRLRGDVERRHLDRWHSLRKVGNEAVHEGLADFRLALEQLKNARSLAIWHCAQMGTLDEAPEPFRAPPSPDARQRELERHLESLRAQTEEERRAREAVERELNEARDAATWWSLTNRVRRALADAALDDLTQVGLPDWAAAIAAGESPPADVPEELVEDLMALGKHVNTPKVVVPEVSLRSHGNFASSYKGGFSIDVETPWLERKGATWVDASGSVHLLPLELARALDQLSVGPPQDSTQERRLWWGRLRRTLEPFGVKLDGFLENSDAVVVEKLKPRLVLSDDGEPTLVFGAEGVDADRLTPAVERFSRAKPNPTLNWRKADGSNARQQLVMSPTAQKGALIGQRLRRHPDALPYLIDAPESVLDPELFDLSEYGDRVVGIGKRIYRVNAALIGTPGFSLASDVDGEPVTVELTAEEQEALASQLLEAARRKVAYVSFRDGWVRVPSPERAERLGKPGDAKPILLVAENIDDAAFSAEDLGEGTLAAEHRRPPGLAEPFELMPHQRVGLAWLAGHVKLGEAATDHGMLADDMGLGKTLQVLSVMSLLADQGELSPCLLVAPVSLLQNWESEADRFFPGRFSRRIDIRGVDLDTVDLTAFDLVLTSYATLRQRQLTLGRVRWKLMVLDESHEIRTPSALQTNAVLAMDAERRLALTGTPVQNSLTDLWSQFDWLAPGLLGSLRSFRQQFTGAANGDGDNERFQPLRERLGARILRRSKAEELKHKLPEKRVTRAEIPMSTRQEQLYDSILRDFREEASPLKTLTTLLRCCAEPDALTLGEGLDNPKLVWLLDQLQAIERAGEKAVVFAEWYSLQDAVVRAVETRFGIPVDRINGQVSAGLRLGRVQAFNEAPGFGVLVLGPKAAGVGLNITGANHVFHLTRPWNPAVEAQATDRVYRIGQTRPVTVHLPISTHSGRPTIELHVDALLAEKESVASDLLTPIESLEIGEHLRERVLGR